jgi:hypothetical protein
MKKSLIAIAFAAASIPMMFAQTAPANPPATGNAPAKTASTVKKHKKAHKAVKKAAPKTDAGTSK